MSRRSWVLAITALLTGALVAAPASGTAATQALPDLGMAHLSDFVVTNGSGGQKQLRFSATIVNVGSGAFEVVAHRSSTGAAWSVAQRIHTTDGAYSDVPVPGVELIYGGDGHDHWHVKNLQSYVLERIDNGVKVGTSMKSGFCFFDTDSYRLTLAGAPSSPVYRASGCGRQASLDLTMGVSVGWGDRYPWTLPDQYIDITSLANGRYRLRATADPNGWFTEVGTGNNQTWVDLNISSNKNNTKIRVLGHGPAA